MALKQRVTISDIAQRSGASRTTVSLVLRDLPGISAETRDRVLAVAQELGYERRGSATRGRTDVRTVAILFRARTRTPYDRSLGFNPFYSWVLTGMEGVARTRNMNLIFGTLAVDNDNRIIDAPGHLLDQDLDGVVLIGAFTETSIADLVGDRTYPVVVVDGPSVPQRFDVIASDNVGGAAAAVRHLIAAGHRHIGLVAPPASANPNFAQREQGYREAMQEAGLHPVAGRLHGEQFDDALQDLLRQDPDVTALFVVNDAFAVGVVKAAIEAGHDVPESLSVMGFDDTDHAVTIAPELSTMRVDKIGMGRHAILQLDCRITWPDGAQVMRMLSPQLVSRGSVAAPVTPNTSRTPARQGGHVGRQSF